MTIRNLSGSAIFTIFIAIVLFAALSYAATQSLQGGGRNIDGEKAKLDQGVMDSYMAAVNTGVTRLQFAGCTTIDYTPPVDWGAEDKSCYLFHPDGGAVSYQDFGKALCIKPLTSLAQGELCGGLIYAGSSGGRRLYTTTANQGSYPWKAGVPDPRTNTDDTGSTSDGQANTDAMEVAGLAFHPAGAACRALGQDWYLPAKDELATLYANQALGALTGSFSPARYWSSSQANNVHAWSKDFGTGAEDFPHNGKENAFLVRCVRRD